MWPVSCIHKDQYAMGLTSLSLALTVQWISGVLAVSLRKCWKENLYSLGRIVSLSPAEWNGRMASRSDTDVFSPLVFRCPPILHHHRTFRHSSWWCDLHHMQRKCKGKTGDCQSHRGKMPRACELTQHYPFHRLYDSSRTFPNVNPFLSDNDSKARTAKPSTYWKKCSCSTHANVSTPKKLCLTHTLRLITTLRMNLLPLKSSIGLSMKRTYQWIHGKVK